MSTENEKSYIEALKVELAGVVRSGDKVAQSAVKAELDRVSGKKVEKAVKADDTEKAAAPKTSK
jgi:hypothetical protein